MPSPAPPASGKTNAALALLAAVLSQRGQACEIISDSALVYRGMDIGTAKPTAQERAAVPHHLIDILDPLQSYSAAEFYNTSVWSVKSARAAPSRCWWAAPCCTSKRCWMALTKCPPQTLPCAPELMRKLPARLAGRRRTGQGRPGNRRPPRPPRTASAFSVRWRCGGSPASHCRAFTIQKRELLTQSLPSIARFLLRTQRPCLAACEHCPALRCHAASRFYRRGKSPARTRRPEP